MSDKENVGNLYSFVLSSVYYGRLLPYFLSLCCLSVLFGLTPYLNLYISGLFYTYLRGTSYAFFLSISISLIIQQTCSALLHGTLQVGSSILGAYQSFLLRKQTNALVSQHMKDVDKIEKLDQKAVADLDTVFSYANQLILSVIGSLCSLVGNFVFLAQFSLLHFTFAFFSFVIANNLFVYFLSSSGSYFSLDTLIRSCNNQATTLRANTRTIETYRSIFSGLPTKLTWFLESFRLDTQRYTQSSYIKILYRAVVETSQQILTRLVHPLVAYLIVRLYQIPFPLSTTTISSLHIVGLGSILQVFKTYSGLWKEGSLCKKNMDTLAKSSSAYRNFFTAYSALGGSPKALPSLFKPQRLPSVYFSMLRSILVFLLLHRSLAGIFYMMEGLSVFFPASIFFTPPTLQLAVFTCFTALFYQACEAKTLSAGYHFTAQPRLAAFYPGLFSRLDIDLASNIIGLVIFAIVVVTVPSHLAYLPSLLSISAVMVATGMLAWHEKKLNQQTRIRHSMPAYPPTKSSTFTTPNTQAPTQAFSLQKAPTHDSFLFLKRQGQDYANQISASADRLFIKIQCRQSDLRSHITTTPSLTLRHADGSIYSSALSPLQTLFYSFLISQPLSLTKHDQTLLKAWPLAEQALLHYLSDGNIHFDIMASGHLAQLKQGNVPEHLSGGQQVKLSCAILYAAVTLINTIPQASIFIGLDEGSGLEGFNTQDQRAVFSPLCSQVAQKPHNRFVIITHDPSSHCLSGFSQPHNSPTQYRPHGCSL